MGRRRPRQLRQQLSGPAFGTKPDVRGLPLSRGVLALARVQLERLVCQLQQRGVYHAWMHKSGTTPHTFDSALEGSTALSDWIGESLGESLGARGELNDRERIAMGLLSIALDHREATLLLVSAGARSSSMALMRPTFEAVAFGCWMAVCATDDLAAAFIAGRAAPSLDVQIRGLQQHGSVGRLFGHIKRLHGKPLDDFVHSGPRQVSRWISPHEIGPRHSDAEMIEVLRYVDLLGLLACVIRERLTGRDSQPFVLRVEAMLGR